MTRTMVKRTEPPPHMVQLDGLRGLAILSVMVGHFVWPLVPLRLGLLGVRLFFVLSGFLITGILLASRDAVAPTGGSWLAARRFYIRRFLRIFPVYYATLFFAVVALHSADTRKALWWHALFGSNIYFSALGDWVEDGDHLWSLATEEQFYLLWPWMVLWGGERLLPLIVLLILSAPVFRAWCLVLGNDVAAYTLLPSCLDSLGLGALLAVLRHEPQLGPIRQRVHRLALCIGGPLALGFVLMDPVYCWLYHPALEREWVAATRAYWLVPGVLSVSLFFVWLVDGAADGFTKRILATWPMVSIGRISYGLYLFHPYAYEALPFVFAVVPFARPRGLLWSTVFRISLSIAMATLSWRCFERPLNDLKKYFPYPRSLRGTSTSPA